MQRYQVVSGPLKVTLVAETAYDAAVEAVNWWGRRVSAAHSADHRRQLEAEMQVRGREGNHRIHARFATFNVIAATEHESTESAWNRLLDSAVAHHN
jgi:hypothetical protein